MEPMTIGMITVGILSCLSSFSVILTYFMFHDMRRKRFMQFIFYIALSDFFMNITSSFGFPANSSVCFVQGYFSFYFTLTGWLWTTALSYAVYCVIFSRPVPTDTVFYLICWILPIICTSLPLSFATYGSLNPDYQWCGLVAIHNTPNGWLEFCNFGLFWGLFYIFVSLMFVCGVRVYRKMQSERMKMSIAIQRMYDKVAFYPVIMLVTWIISFCSVQFRIKDGLVVYAGMMAGTLNGMCTAALFFSKSDEARLRWYHWYVVTILRDTRVESNCVDILQDFDEAAYTTAIIDPLLHNHHMELRPTITSSMHYSTSTGDHQRISSSFSGSHDAAVQALSHVINAIQENDSDSSFNVRLS